MLAVRDSYLPTLDTNKPLDRFATNAEINYTVNRA